MLKNGEQPESVVCAGERENPWCEGFVKEVGFELGMRE